MVGLPSGKIQHILAFYRIDTVAADWLPLTNKYGD